MPYVSVTIYKYGAQSFHYVYLKNHAPTSGLISIAGSSIAVAEGSVSCTRGKSRESRKKLRGSNRFANYNATVRRLSSLSQVHIYFPAVFFFAASSPCTRITMCHVMKFTDTVTNVFLNNLRETIYTL